MPASYTVYHYTYKMTLLVYSYFHTAGAQFFSLPRQLVNTSAIITSVLFESSCNPVVHAAAFSTLSIATQQNPFRVQNIREFMDLEKGLVLTA